MREIKFRAWVLNYETDKYEMYNWCPYFFSDASPVSSYSDDFPKADTTDVILMQYTGLKDCNDKEIYEGDILKCVLPDFGKKDSIMHIVKWDERIEKSDMHSGEGYVVGFNMSILDLAYTEIVGNIYENPELLKE
jgi:uncharacterized phage protein (TIGR01671 family)